MTYTISGVLLVVALFHLMPLIGVLGADRLVALYGAPINDVNLVVLMRHRAVLFGLLGGFIAYSVLRSDLQWLALVAGLVSVASFIWLAGPMAEMNSQIARVVMIDWIALALSVIGLVLKLVILRSA